MFSHFCHYYTVVVNIIHKHLHDCIFAFNFMNLKFCLCVKLKKVVKVYLLTLCSVMKRLAAADLLQERLEAAISFIYLYCNIHILYIKGICIYKALSIIILSSIIIILSSSINISVIIIHHWHFNQESLSV